MLRSAFLWGPVALYMAAIFFVSSLSAPPVPGGVSDKTLHVAAYTVLAILAVRALAGGLPARVRPRTAVVALAIAVGYGITDEVHQMFVPGRHADVADVIADAAGAAIGVALCWAWGILAHRNAA